MSIAESSQHDGAMLAVIRQAAGLSQRQLARALGVSHSHLSRVESGERELTDDLWLAAAQVVAEHKQAGAA